MLPNLCINTVTLLDIDNDGDLDIVYGAVGSGRTTIFALETIMVILFKLKLLHLFL